MYTKRAAFVAVNSLKVRRTAPIGFRYFVASFHSVRNHSTATERSDFYNNFDGNVTENQSGCNDFDRNDRFQYRNPGGVELNQNPSRVYGQIPKGQFGNFSVRTGVETSRHLVGVEQKENLAPDQSLDGYDGGGDLGISPQNDGGTWQHSSTGRVFGKVEYFETEFGGRGGEKVEMLRPTEWNTGMYQQNDNRIYNRIYEVNNQQNSSGFQGGANIDCGVAGDMGSNKTSVDGTQECQPNRKIEDLDELCREGKLKEAVELLELLKKDGVQVDLARYIALMKACGENETLEEAKTVHADLLKSVPNIDVRTYNKILEMYSKCGSMDNACAVFGQMPQRNLTSWDIMMNGLARNGLAEDSIELFSEFKRSGLKPDGQTFISVFSACGVLCDTVEGMLHFESMTKDYGIIPSMEHYVSIVDMLGNAGCLDEALEFIEKMPVEPIIDIWETLMKFCRIHGNVELGDRCTELVQLLDSSRLNEQSMGGLIPISDTDLSKEKAKKKLNGSNLLDVRSRAHEYKAGDRSHPEHERLYALLRGLMHQMKEVGYIPDTKFVLHDVDQEDKQEALMAHSERLAAAQGFLTSAPRHVLRIMKNLRVCVDCHNAFKIISKIVGREVIARDSKRFHHFKDGSCSCNDYW